ncbi:MAG: nicotinamide-nucleotide adenylyltransferase [Candidatus Korarchaeota archaeon NZ13-K]|nr:MAG: nicotinamide-nucleotide adenylyltransferase [Candidatus Korarchaeota archaeon NZ13-K]
MFRRALVVGRFQPLHYGHLHLFRYALSRAEELVIGIGSSQFCCQPRNPLSAGERMEIIVVTLRREGFPMERISITCIPDTESADEKWGLIVLDRVPKIDVAFSNDPETIRCLREVGVHVENVPFFKREIYEATKIRELILRGDDSWKQLVPKPSLNLLMEMDFEGRVRMLGRNG